MTVSPEHSSVETAAKSVRWMPREPYLHSDAPLRQELIDQITAGIDILGIDSLQNIAKVTAKEVRNRPHGDKSLRGKA